MTTSLAQKLQLKPGQQLRVSNSPTGYAEPLATALPGITVISDPGAAMDAILLFVNSLDEADRLVPPAIAAVKSAGLLWVAYPKGGSKINTDVNRDRLWKALEPTGWQPVRQVALDDVWSAMRFRPAELVGK